MKDLPNRVVVEIERLTEGNERDCPASAPFLDSEPLYIGHYPRIGVFRNRGFLGVETVVGCDVVSIGEPIVQSLREELDEKPLVGKWLRV